MKLLLIGLGCGTGAAFVFYHHSSMHFFSAEKSFLLLLSLSNLLDFLLIFFGVTRITWAQSYPVCLFFIHSFVLYLCFLRADGRRDENSCCAIQLIGRLIDWFAMSSLETSKLAQSFNQRIDQPIKRKSQLYRTADWLIDWFVACYLVDPEVTAGSSHLSQHCTV